MPNEPIDPSAPLPRRRVIGKKTVLVSLLLAAIVAAAVVVIVLFTTDVFSSTTQPQTQASAALTAGINANRYENQTSKLNGGVVCEDFAADASKPTAERNFSVDQARATDSNGASVTITTDAEYDAALAAADVAGTKAKPPVIQTVRYYGKDQN